MQITFKTEKGELLFVKVPEYSFAHWLNPVIKNSLHYHTPQLDGMLDIDIHTVKLDNNDYQFIGRASQITEEQAMELVDDPEIVAEVGVDLVKDIYGYLDYSDEDNCFVTALDSFKSILQHLGIDFDPIVLFKPNNCF